MTLQPPNLDDRTFDQLVEEARRRIPQYTPEWTDLNPSDPGMTLVDLFAWLTELMLYRFNQIPDRTYVKFLDLLGLRLEAAHPARADLTFTPQGGVRAGPVPARTRVGAPNPDGGPPLVFETTSGLGLVLAPLTAVRAFDPATGAFTDVTDRTTTVGTPFRPFGWAPQPGSALHLGFGPLEQPLPAAVAPFPDEIALRVLLAADPSGTARVGTPDAVRPVPPVALAWEYKSGPDPAPWLPLQVHDDETAAFTRDGYVRLQGPPPVPPVPLADREPPRWWVRARLASGRYPAGGEPRVDLLAPNTVPAENLATVQNETVGISEGHPNQSFALLNAPVSPGSLTLEVIPQAGTDDVPPDTGSSIWRLVEDLLEAGPRDRVFTLDPTPGRIAFGDGRHGAVPVAGARLLVTRYRHGGGAAANRRPGEINRLIDTVPGVQAVSNLTTAAGGADAQTLADLKERAPAVLRHRDRAVTVEDFADLAELATREVVAATAIPLAHPDFPGVDVPGAVTVVIVTRDDDGPQAPSAGLLAAVRAHLEQYRLLTTELSVQGPTFFPVDVEVQVVIAPTGSPDTVRNAVGEAVDAALDPLRAAPRQAFGRPLYPTSLYAAVLAVADVTAVPHLALRVRGVPHDRLEEPVLLPPDGLVRGGRHTVTSVRRQDLS